MAGVVVKIRGEEKICKAKVLFATFDLPAKAKALNFNQFNGKYGCSVCKQEGLVVRVGRGNARVYQCAQPLAPLRSHEECYAFGVRALQKEEVHILIN